MLKTLLLALCCAVCFLPAIEQNNSVAQSDRDTDSDEVYAAAVAWRLYDPSPAPKPKQLIFLETTEPYRCLAEAGRCPSSVRESLDEFFGQALRGGLLDEYFEQNKDRGPLSKSFPTALPKAWLSEEEKDALFKKYEQGAWQVLFSRYPGARSFMALSRVGFNDQRDTALLYSSVSCGALCGSGDYLLLKKVSGKWIVTRSYMAWIS